MSRYTRFRDKVESSAPTVAAANLLGLPEPVTSVSAGGAAAEALTPDLNVPDMQALPDVPGPQGVPVRDQLVQQQLAASGVQATGSGDLPGTGLFGPKKKAASRALQGY